MQLGIYYLNWSDYYLNWSDRPGYLEITVNEETVNSWRKRLLELFTTREMYFHITKKGLVVKDFTTVYYHDNDVVGQVQNEIRRITKAQHGDGVTPLMSIWLYHLFSKKDLERAKVEFKKNFADEISRRREHSRKIREVAKSLK